MFSRSGSSAVRHEATDQLDEMVECRAIFGEGNLVSQSNHAQRKLIRVGAAEMGVSTLGGSGGMLSREILKFSFSKTHISRIL